MKTPFLSTSKLQFVIILLFFMSSLSHLSAQDRNVSEDLFFEIACFKAKTAGVTNYFQTTGKSINEELLKQGIIVDWKLFKVDFPNGSTCECDYRAIRVFRGMVALEKLKNDSIRNQIIKNIWPHKTKEDIGKEFGAIIDFRYSEVYNLVDALIPEVTNSNIMVVNFMNVKPENRRKYVQMELDVFKPLHALNHKKGKLVDWVLARRTLPYGSQFPNGFITIDKYQNYDDMNNTQFKTDFKKAHPDKDFEVTMSKMSDLRVLSKSEIWKPITVGKLN